MDVIELATLKFKFDSLLHETSENNTRLHCCRVENELNLEKQKIVQLESQVEDLRVELQSFKEAIMN